MIWIINLYIIVPGMYKCMWSNRSNLTISKNRIGLHLVDTAVNNTYWFLLNYTSTFHICNVVGSPCNITINKVRICQGITQLSQNIVPKFPLNFLKYYRNFTYFFYNCEMSLPVQLIIDSNGKNLHYLCSKYT